jgi:asparagine synthase (glutamine-hydrolysing)
MSAIAGIYHLNGEPISPEHGAGLMKFLEQFPANDIQTWQKENIFLGCHAQWITPESIGEKLPYYDHERQLTITADAIIDNREELFSKLQVKKAKQKAISDSELILLAYNKWEEECPKYLVGDFAFMIWDERKQKLFGARDFSGARTLYYFNNQQRFAFCTIINPIFSLPYVLRRLDEQWLAEYLAIIGMIDVVDSSLTPYQHIKQVPPAHSITIINGSIHLNRYCTLSSNKILKLKTNEEYVEAFQEVYQEAVSSRLRTYRNIGAQLSGGLDSGSIVAFASSPLGLQNKKLLTYSYIPPSDFQDFTPKHLLTDESPLIKEVVNYVPGIVDSYLDFEGRDSYSEMNSFIEMMEMPYKFFENSFWLRGMFEKASEDDVGILLNGGRGNLSISWGTAIDYYGTLLKRLRIVHLYSELNQYSRNVGGNRLRRLPIIARTAFPIIDKIFPQGRDYDFPLLINPEFAKKTKVFNKLKQHGIDESGWFSSANIFEQRKSHFEEVFHWNASNTLASKLSLRYAVWKRDPTNDLRVIRFCLSLPEEQYVQNGLDRALIRRATENYLPDSIRLNQRIRGVQGADWVHRMIPKWNQFTEEISQLCSDQEAKMYLNPEVLEKAHSIIQEGIPHPENATNPYFKILMRSLIVYKFIKTFTEGR